MDFIILGFFSLILVNFRSLCSNNECFLDVETSQQLKGIFSVFVVFSHIGALLIGSSSKFLPIMLDFGRLSVAVFFFLSAYGLKKSFLLKGSNYLNHFLLRHVSKVFLPFFFAIWIYYVQLNLFGEISVKVALLSIVNGNPIVTYGWFCVAICFFYLIFYLAGKFAKNNEKLFHLILLIGTLVYMIYCRLNYGQWWIDTCFAFLLGSWYATYEKRINQKVSKRFKSYFLIACLAFAFFYTVMEYTGFFLVCQLLSQSFLCCLFLILSKVKLESRLFTYLSRYSYEIYLYQGLAFTAAIALRNQFIIFQNNELFLLFGIGLTILFSILFSKIYNGIFVICCKIKKIWFPKNSY